MPHSRTHEFERKLLEEREHIQLKLKKLDKELDYGAGESIEDEANEVEEISNQASIRVLFERELERIDRALQKINAGTYGVCERCGGEISDTLFAVDPESALCKNCKLEGSV
jgi:RNA polymerase-binding transcription factor DksA